MNIREDEPDSIVSLQELDTYRTLYDDLTNNGIILKYHHRHALGELAVMLVEMKSLRLDISTNGEHMTVNGDKGNTVSKRNPSRDALDKLRMQVKSYFKEFKMTPASQGKVLGLSPTDNDSDGFGDV